MTDRIQWPGGHRAALAVIIAVLPDESYTRTGLRHLSATLADLDIPATIAIDNDVRGDLDDVVAELSDAGHAVAVVGDGDTIASSADEAKWTVRPADADIPFIGDDDAIVIPVSPFAIDRTWLPEESPNPPSTLLEAWSLALAEHRADGSAMTVVVHPHIMGRPGLRGTLVRFLDEAIASGDVWLTSIEHLALFVRALDDERKDNA